jgi:hypothetical protein
MRALRLLAAVVIVTSGITLAPSERASVAVAAECAANVGPGIPPPASVPSGVPGFHAAWYGQSGYPTLCPGQTSKAVVAYYNSGSIGWLRGIGQYVALGTWGPNPGQDQPSFLGGDGIRGTENMHWPAPERPSAMPADYIGPGQVAWFQFTVKAPKTPGTYRLYIRPLIEDVEWMEDYGVFWQVTVLPAGPPQRVTVSSVDANADSFTAGADLFRFDRNDSFQASDAAASYQDFKQLLSVADVVDVRYESTAAGMSSFNIVADFGNAPPTVKAEVGNFDGGPTKNDVTVTITPPASNVPADNWRHRALVPAGTSTCEPTSGSYLPDHPQDAGSFVDRNLASGTYCYRAGPRGGSTLWNAFGYSAPVTVPAP